MPLAAVVALTDAVTRSVRVKLLVCVGTTSVAQLLLALGGLAYLLHVDWRQAAKVVQQRAHADRQGKTAPRPASDAQPAPAGPEQPQQPEPSTHQAPLLINTTTAD